MRSSPTIMVSSTFYDLRQIRADLASFILGDLGYIPLLSELPSFPVNPDLDTLENCRARVEKNADILVLVIGGRYGSIDDKTEKSITNLEFLTARRKGIPVYAFVEKSILSVMPIWEKNPSGDFSAAVDTPRLFEFIEYVRNQERVWTFSFETAQEIVSVLRLQLSHLFYDALQIRLRLNGIGLPPYFESLRPKSLKIILEKPAAWEYRLFLQSWIDEVERRTDIEKEYRAGLRVDVAESVVAIIAKDWMLTRLHELGGLIDSVNSLINVSTQKAFGKPGETGDAEDIVWVSRMLGKVYENVLKWARRLRCAKVEAPFDKIVPELVLIVDDLISKFQDFPSVSLEKLEEALTNSASEEPVTLKLTMDLTLSNVEKVNKAILEAQRHYDSHQGN